MLNISILNQQLPILLWALGVIIGFVWIYRDIDDISTGVSTGQAFPFHIALLVISSFALLSLTQ